MVRQEVAREIDRLVGRVLQDAERLGHLDLEASEMAIRATMHQVGGHALGQLLNADGGGHGVAHTACGQGHPAAFVDYRPKEILTVLAPVTVRRAYYHCAACAGGVIPKDRELDVVGTSFSPGVRRLMGRGGKGAFAEGRGDLEELAGIVVQTKAVERVAEILGEQVEVVARQEREAALAGKLVRLKPVPRLYIAIDGTGVPVLPHETEGRPGKETPRAGQGPGGQARVGLYPDAPG